MSAQSATATLLAYGPQGTQQLATAALLSYTPPASAQRVVATFGAPWAKSKPQEVETRAPMHNTDALDPATRAPWGAGRAQQRITQAPWVPAGTIDRERSAPWQQFARRLQAQSAQPWVVSRKSDAQARAPWGEFAGRPALTAVAVWVRAVVSDRQNTGPWGEYASRPVLLVRPSWATARRADAESWIPWVRFGRPLDPGWGVVVEDGGPPVDENGTVIVPVRRVYMTVNQITLTRVSDGMPLSADGFTMSIDTDSWTWQWSASMQPHLRQYLTPVAGVPVQVEATINGVPYRLCAESVSSNRSFGSARISVRGRGLGAVLDAPYAPTQNFGNSADRTAQQLMADVLTVNGVGIGWAVDWGLTDWLVPAGAWSHQGNYLSAITAIAAAAGGYVQPHATAQTLRILPRYPHKPWDWAAVLPDVQLPADVVSVEGIDWTAKPAYNRVHVSGVAQGVLAEATRAGTAGNTVAPMVTDALITHADAARQRALAVLADTGAQARVTLKLPVLAETGLILPGKYVRYTDGPATRTGIVRGTSVDWSRPTLRQTLQLETHGTD